MTTHRPIFTSFNGGEISQRMMGRIDTSIYAIATEICENFTTTVEGPIVKRPGFEYIRDAAPTSAWLSTFKFSLTQEYLLEWSDGKIRFFTNGERIEISPGVPYEVAVPYTADEAAELSFQQSYDRLYIAHRNHPPAMLTRTAAAIFVYSPLTLINGPFLDQNSDKAIRVTASGETDNINLAATSNIFSASQVGGLIRFEAEDFGGIPAWEVGRKSIAVGNFVRSEGKIYQAASSGTTGTVQPIHLEGTESDGTGTKDINDNGPYGVQWTYVSDNFGIARITAVASGGLEANATVERRLPQSVSTVGTYRWSLPLFGNDSGWPNIIMLAFGRMIFFRDFDVVGSVSGDYGGGRVNFATHTTSGLTPADLGFRKPLATSDPAIWAIGDRTLVVGTASREIAIERINPQAAFSGDNLEAKPQSFYGSEIAWPLQNGTSTFFVQRGGRKLREANYDFSQDRYIAANATVWARHISKSGIKQLTFQKEPEELVIAVRMDGQLFVRPHQAEQEIKGFSRWRHSDGLGKILSSETIVGADGKTDETWALVERDGAKSIERMFAWRDDGDPIEDAFFVDSGVTVMAAAGQTHFSGAGHLANMDVAVLAAGAYVPNIRVAADGTFDLPIGVVPEGPYRVTVGLPFTATCTTLRPEIRVEGRTSQGRRQRLVSLALRLLDTVGISVGARDAKLDNLIDRPANAPMDAPIPLFTGDSERAVSGDWNRDGQATFTSSLPLPAIIVAAMPAIDLG